MVNQNELYKALMNGSDPDKLAKQFTDALNAAMAQKKDADIAAQKAKEAEKAKAAKEAAKLTRTEEVLKIVKDYCAEFYPDIHINLTAKEAVNALDSATIEFKPLVNSIKKNFNDLDRLMKDDPFENFLHLTGM